MREVRVEDWSVFARDLGHRLSEIRVRQGLSQASVAGVAGIAQGTYQRLENGESQHDKPANPYLRNIMRVCQALRVDLDDVMPDWWPDLTEGRLEA
jgi:transcriptional regulator with XRE-family HTH domain